MSSPCDFAPYICPYSEDPCSNTCLYWCSTTDTYDAHADEYSEEDCYG